MTHKPTTRPALLPAVLVLLLAVWPAFGVSVPKDVEPQPLPTPVETFTSTSMSQVMLPGVVTAQGVRFSIVSVPLTLSFTAGSKGFGDQSVEFSGKEASFLTSQVSGSMEYLVGATPTPRTLMAAARGTFTISGAVNASGQANYAQVATGPGFSATSFNLEVGDTCALSADTTSWSSSEIPELNGSKVSVEVATRLTQVDAANGLIEDTLDGTISAQDTVQNLPTEEPADLASTQPARDLLGLLLLGAGALGMLRMRGLLG